MKNIEQLLARSISYQTRPFAVDVSLVNYAEGYLAKEAGALMEPLGTNECEDLIVETYYDLLDNDMSAWLQFIKTNTEYEPKWYALAVIISEAGY